MRMASGVRTSQRTEGKGRRVKGLIVGLTLVLSLLPPAAVAQRQEFQTSSDPMQGELVPPRAEAVTPVAKLIEEAERNNPEIAAARHGWKAAAQVPTQVSTLPDPQLVLQQLNVGSPRPFAGFTNSDFAYIGIGASQDLPYPGKLRLRGEIAERDAASARDHAEAVRRSVVERLQAAYVHLAYLQQTLAVLERDGKLLEQVESIAESHYRVGQGNQQDVLKAQLERTRLVRMVAMHHQEMWSAEAQLKQLLNRPPDSSDIGTEPLTETPLPYSSEELLARVRASNPDVGSQFETVRRQGLQVELAHKDAYPDFNVQYMWQHTAEQFRDYHMLSFGVRIPVYRSRKQQPELAQAAEELNRSRREYEATVQQTYFDVRDQFLAAQTSAQLLKIYREGLIPQATATFQAGLAAYESNRQDFETLLASFVDVLNFDEEYWRALADHETALARLEQLTGVALH
jgi:outer membrane protein, heavy metal efflux system